MAFVNVELNGQPGGGMSRWRKGAVLIAVASSVVDGSAQTAKGPEKGPWVTHTLQISDWKLTMTLPGTLSTDFPVFKTRDSVDLEALKFKVPYPVDLLKMTWDYRGHFWQGVFGSLSMRVSVIKNLQDSFDLTKPDDFKAFLQGRDSQGIFYPDRLGAEAWLHQPTLRSDGAKRSDDWFRALDAKHCLMISFELIPGMDTDSSRTDWNAQAITLEQTIRNSIALTRTPLPPSH